MHRLSNRQCSRRRRRKSLAVQTLRSSKVSSADGTHPLAQPTMLCYPILLVLQHLYSISRELEDMKHQLDTVLIVQAHHIYGGRKKIR